MIFDWRFILQSAIANPKSAIHSRCFDQNLFRRGCADGDVVGAFGAHGHTVGVALGDDGSKIVEIDPSVSALAVILAARFISV